MIILFLRYYSFKNSQKKAAEKAKEAAAREAEARDIAIQTEASITQQLAPEILG